MKFKNRQEAGKILVHAITTQYPALTSESGIVLALPRGGVPVAYEIARALKWPLDVWLVRKLGVPGYEELAFGAMAYPNTMVLNDDVVLQSGITQAQINEACAREKLELTARNKLFRKNLPPINLTGKIALLVDDGVATGATMRAAIQSIRALHPKKIFIAVPVSSVQAYDTLHHITDEFIALQIPDAFYAVGAWYEDFPQVSNDEVLQYLNQGKKKP